MESEDDCEADNESGRVDKTQRGMTLGGNFKVEELVCPHVWKRFGRSAERFIDARLLDVLEALRVDILKAPITINDWHAGGGLTQRGLRCNLCALVKNRTSLDEPYLSAHVLGKAADCTVKGTTAEEARGLIVERQDLLPHPIRLEKDTSWLHVDVATDAGAGKITFF